MSQKFPAFSLASYSARLFKVICETQLVILALLLCICITLSKESPPSFCQGLQWVNIIDTVAGECDFKVRRKILTGLYRRHN